MKTEKKWYFVIVLAITILLYDQYLGLNSLIITFVSIGYLYTFNKDKKTKTWWLSSGLWLLSGLSVFLSNTYTGGVMYFFTLINFVAINNNQKYSFPYTFLHTVFSFFIGIAKFVTPIKKESIDVKNQNWEEVKEKTDVKILKKIFLYGIPLLLVIVFLKLYQFANPKFAEYTAFINFKFINWYFILLYAILLIALYGLYLFNNFQTSYDWDFKHKNLIDESYTDQLQTKIGTETEQKMAVMLLSVLNILLVAFLVIDGITLFSTDIDSELTHSETVHQGINILITSIVLVIFIVGFIYRGALNFLNNKTIKILTVLWLVLNLVITVFNSIKNYHYIDEWGLTHKRIGVYTYLALCVIGLLFTLYKVLKQKSFVFLVRRVSYSFVSFLVVYSLFNWTSIIANYNLDDTHFSEDKIDFYYNLDLGFEAYPALVKYFNKHPNANRDVREELDYKINNHMNNLKFNWKEIPSIKYSEYIIEQKLKTYVPLKVNNYQPSSRWSN